MLERLASLGRILRDALVERIAVSETRPLPRAASSPSSTKLTPVASSADASFVPAVPAARASIVAVPSPEAGLVRGLFANPQSLVAAFIVAEVLAKPVALRER